MCECVVSVCVCDVCVGCVSVCVSVCVCERMCVCVCVCVCMYVDLVIQHAACLRHIIVCPTPLYIFFPHYIENDTIFEIHITVYRMRIMISSTTFLVLRRTDRDMIKNVY